MKKTLLTLVALAGFSGLCYAGNGTEASPYTVAEFNAATLDANAEVYVQGYIVGWIGNENKQNVGKFEIVPGIVNTNLLLAATSSEDQFEACIAVQLPSGSVRDGLNLVTHPENLGHQVILRGKKQRYCGQDNGLKETKSYTWVGDAPVYVAPDPIGTEAAPITIPELLKKVPNGANTWVEGYIVGFVNGSALESGATFNATDASNTNILLAPTADCKELSQCIPVGVAAGTIRDELCLQKAPGNLYRKVKVLGSYEVYFSVPGVKNVAQYAFDGSAPVVPPTPPVVSDGTIYSGLNPDDATTDWTIDNGTLPEGLTYVFSWKGYNDKYYMNASAYVGGKNYATDAYAYSPVIDLTNVEGPITLTFDHAAKFQNGDVKKEFTVAVREEGGSWKQFEIPVMPTKGAWTFTNCGNIDITEFAGKKVNVALHYVSTDSAADTWEVRDLKITGSTAVSAIDAEEGEAIYFNLQGARVANPENGIYVKVQGKKASKVVIR